ncbi:amino acid adenylation domain-containing protein [Nonomuraea turkmeniaca]|uniref:Phenyloxazoline synthase MbtB n=1 Tax=Nonomuraea turkmeniaca TaxID=103838 RepID=A0A5S4FVH8_9ACTN|nr:non-ribosomal peptide synthetase [Nonomuraea turkmeniaca]TMR24787.1 amino acid adenylation domain-containing protein [Nonomuraea turkmeniaca]
MPLTLEIVRNTVADLLQRDPGEIGDHDNLIRCGMDSITAMRLAGRWRRAGVRLDVAELAETPTIGHWWSLISARQGQPLEAAVEVKVDEGVPFPLTPVQHAYWIGRREGQVLGNVGCHAYIEFDGLGVAPERLQRAVRALVHRHAQLRTRFLDDGTQQALPPDDPAVWSRLTVHDLTSLDAAGAESALLELRETLSHRLLDAAHGEVFDVRLSLLPGGATRIHFELDLLVADVLSLRMILTELAALYADPHAPLPPIDYSFQRYLAEQDVLRAEARARDRAYWQERLADLPGGPQLPLAVPPESVTGPRFVRRSHWLSAEEWERLERRAREHGLTPSTVLAAAYAEVLAAWSATPRFLLNLPLFDRHDLHPSVGHLVADFTSLVLLEVDASESLPFAELARRIQARLHADLAHTDYSGIEVLRDLTRAHPGSPPTAPVVFAGNLDGELVDPVFRRELGELGWMISQTPQVWLDYQMVLHDGRLVICWDAVAELFPAGVLDAMFAAHGRLLEWLGSADWAEPVPSLVPEPQVVVRERVNDTTGPAPGRLLHEGFFAQDPERVALVWDGGSLSYGELADRVLRVAGWLRSRGVRPGDPVGVVLPKGPEQVTAVLGVLAAGGVYVPVGVDQPAARRERILSRAGVEVVLTELSLGERLSEPVQVDPEQPAYVIFTSGSTGEPKGVQVSHRAAVNTIEDVVRRFGLGQEDRVLAVSALDFDLSVFDIFGLLSVGGAVVLIGEDERRDAERWAQLVADHQVTVWNSVPALLDMLLTAGGGGGLRLALVSGDWVGLDLAPRLADEAPEARLIALGGATEAAIWSNYCRVPAEVPAHWRSVPYGKPLGNQRFRVVDARGRDCPDWVAGELWIGGLGVADGYRGDPEQTAERFLTVEGVRWYRTGDLGRYWPDGTLEFLGRADAQVKIRGHRIELGEVEAALQAEVAQAVVVASADRRRLLAAVASDDVDAEALRAGLAERLPPYMIPDRLVSMAALPLTANGKIDRNAVRALLEETEEARAFVPPQGSVEETVAAVWRELLHAERVGRDDDFFFLGGDSLIATRLVTRLREMGLANATLAKLFRTPVLADFAAGLALTGDERAETYPAIMADHANRYEPFPLTEIQRAYWLGRAAGLPLGGVGTTFYLELAGADIDPPRLEEALNRLIQRHEMLRAVIGDDGRQRILPEVPRLRIPVEEASDAVTASARLEGALARRVFDLGRWPLIDVRVVRHSEGVRLGITLDYSVFDALSGQLLLSELATLYADMEAELPPVGVSFRDYVLSSVHESAARERAEEYWRDRLDELPPAPQLPLAVDPATIAKPVFVRRRHTVPAGRWARIKEQARRHGVTPSVVLLTCYVEVLAAWSGRDDLTVNLTLFDRPASGHPDIGNILGDFTSLLLLANRPDPGETWLAAARRLQEQLAEDLEHRAVSGLWVLRELARRSGSARSDMPVVFTSTLGLDDDLSRRLPDGFPQIVNGLSQTPQVWLDHQVMELGGELVLCWDAVEELFPASVLDAMFAAYQRLLERLGEGNWSQPVPSLLPGSQHAVRELVNATVGPVSGRLLHEGFFAQDPERVALVWDGGSLTYGELADRALRVAGRLRSRGVGPGTPVGVVLPKGPEQVTAVLGVLAAGGMYVPVGVDQPAARRERILARAGVEEMLTELAFGERLSEPVKVHPEQAAYVIFTSGSTGEPKGVQVSHQAAVNTIEDVIRRFDMDEQDRVLAVSALDFDLSVFDIFGLLSVGGAVVLIEEDERRDAERWAQLVAEHGVTVWNSVPALLDMLLTSGGGAGLRIALVSGDWVGPDLAPRLGEQTHLIALGGATEAAIWSNYCRVPAKVPAHWRSVPYGKPLTNQRFRVVDSRGRDCPDWVTGELWIGGLGVADGYRGDPQQTAERFVTVEGVRWYRTGDLGRYWPDGTLEFLGRADAQVKIRGHRIELGEVEAALQAHPHVGQVVAVTSADRRHLLAAVTESIPRAAAEATPRPAGPKPQELPETWELESRLAEALLTGLLADEFGITPTIEAALARNGVDEVNRPIADVWLRWLERWDVVQATPTGHVPGPRFDHCRDASIWADLMDRAEGTHLALIAGRLAERRGDLAAMLRGDREPLTLLDDPVLSPEGQAALRPETATTLQVIAGRLAALAAELGRPLRVAELGARTGRTACRILDAIPPGSVHYTLLDESPVLLDAAKERLSGTPHPVGYAQAPTGTVPAPLRHAFDVVIAAASLHRYPSVAAGVELASLLLAPGGLLYAWELTEPAPLTLQTISLLERGFDRLDRERRRRRSPLLDADRWRDVLTAAHFDHIAVLPQGPFSVLLRAARPATRPVADPDEVRTWLRGRIPGYLVPDRVEVVPFLPLTGNGKVDRRAVQRLLDTGGGAGGSATPPQGPLEGVVAATWSEVLGGGEVSRDADFFMLGGDSLAATRVVARLREAGVGGVTIGRLFSSPVLADFAAGLSMDGSHTAALTLPADPEHRHDPFPLTEVQQAYWLGRQVDYTLGGVGSHCYFEFEGDGIDVGRLEEAFNRLVRRHEMLRAVVTGDGRQRILPGVPRFVIPVADVLDDRFDQARADLRTEMSHQVVDLARWPLLDVRAVRAADGRVCFGLSLDNFVFDGLSMMIVLSEAARLYDDPEAELPPVGMSFRDYVLNSAPDPAARERAEDYWRERLDELPPAPQLPLAVDPATVTRPAFVRRRHTMPADRWSRIKQRARRHGLTPSAVLLTCYAEVLAAWSGRSDVTVNLTLFDRPAPGQPGGHPDIARVIGDFTSLLLVGHRPEPGGGWLDAAQALQRRLGHDLEHRDVSAVWVLRELARRSQGASVGMPVVFTSALGLDDDLFDRAFQAPWRESWSVSQTPQVWLDHQVMELGGELVLCWDAVEELFPAGVLDAMFAAYQRLLGWLDVTDWAEPVPSLVPESQVAVRERVNDTAAPVPGRLLHEGFFAQDPGRVALVWDGGSLTYGELADRALRVAGWLRSRGVGPGTPVGVMLPKGPEQVTAVLGVLAAGGMYVPVGIDQPAARRERILARAGAQVVLTELIFGEPLDEPVKADPGTAAYVIFTSGSTGEPKGVQVSHRAAVNTIEDVVRRFDLGQDDRVLAVSALDFDLSVFDIFGLLNIGGAVVLIGEEERRDAHRWAQLVAGHQVTVWNSVPALLDMLLTAGGGAGLRLALVSGDWVGLDLAPRLRAGAQLIALGGATEAAIWSNCCPVPVQPPAHWRSVPYGRPLANQRFRVVGARGRDCPDWVTGELWIGGLGVADGYRGDPEQTAQRFVTVAGERWYRTGDLGRYWPDGTLEFQGRADAQVKIRGHRIELGEVEAALQAEAAQAVVVASADRRRLLAAVVPEDTDADAVRARLAERLPAYMIPDPVVPMAALPLTANGKIDRNAVRTLLETGDELGDDPPQGPAEIALAAIWAELLDVPAVPRNAGFFALGGDSLVATRLVEAVRRRLGAELTVRQVFATPTIAAMAAQITTETGEAWEEGAI